eukprot:gene9196-1282_t
MKLSSGFVCESSFDLNGTPIHFYKSKDTGLQIMLAEIEGPMVNSYITVSTESDCHDGCPHVLEHLVFFGSEDYPYKGMLDKLANRCFAQGTNAYTDVDHTCYELNTVGKEGTINMLPVYLDHILYPTLTESGFYTEVHHIDEKGENSGVVYAEIKGFESDTEEMISFKVQQTLFKNHSYGSDTGGSLEELRKLDISTVRKYHQEYYRPDNVCIVILGKISIQEVISSITPVESKIIKKNFKPKNTRPWSNPFDSLDKNIENEILIPADDDEDGSVVLAWKYPQFKYNNFLEKKAIKIIFDYLADTSISPLQKTMVESDDNFCSDIEFEMENYLAVVVTCELSDVEPKEFKKAKKKFFKEINKIIEKGIDKKRMKTMLNRAKLQYLSDFESEPSDYISEHFIHHFLYGTNIGDFESMMKEVELIEVLESKDESYWVNLIKTLFIDEPHACIYAKPDRKLGNKLSNDEESRIKKQISQLGKEKLNQLGDDLETAKKQNEFQIPKELLESFKIPDIQSVEFFPVVTYRSNSIPQDKHSIKLQKLIGDEKQDLPIFIQFDHIPVKFVEINVYLDTTEVSDKLRKYLRLLFDCIFEMPIKKKNENLSHEKVTKILSENTIDYDSTIGLNSEDFDYDVFPQLINVKVEIEPSKFSKGLEILKDTLWNTQFTKDRIQLAIDQILNEVPECKTDPGVLPGAALKHLNFDPKKSNHNACNFHNQDKFIDSLDKKMDKDYRSIIKDLNELRDFITDPSRIYLSVIGDFTKIENVKSSILEHFFNESEMIYVPKAIKHSRDLLRKGVNDCSKAKDGIIFGLSATETTSLDQTCPGITSSSDPDLPALLVLIEYLTGSESIFWSKIRGFGLCYQFGITVEIEQGLIYFNISDSTNIFKAYMESKKIIDDILKNSQFDQTLIDSSKSAISYEVISLEETIYDSAYQRMSHYFEGLPSDHNEIMLKRISVSRSFFVQF